MRTLAHTSLQWVTFHARVQLWCEARTICWGVRFWQCSITTVLASRLRQLAACRLP